MVGRLLITAMIFFALTGCKTTPDNASQPGSSSVAPDHLSARNLKAGECGMFVWTADRKRRFILFSQIDRSTADWMSDGSEMTIVRIESDGMATYDQPPSQSFTLPDGGTLSLSLSDPESITEGTRYKSGLIRLKNADGWERMMPVIGLAGCQSAQN